MKHFRIIVITSIFMLSLFYSTNGKGDPTRIVSLSMSETSQIPNISVSLNSIDFGLVNVDSSSPKKVTISNTGMSDLVLNSISITGSDNDMFSLTADSCRSLTPIIARGKKCTIKVIFLPKSEGIKVGDIIISSNDPDNHNLDISLTGTGVVNGLNKARSVGIKDDVMRVSGLRQKGISQVADYFLKKNATSLSLIKNSVTTSLPPSISNLVTDVFPNDIASCGNAYPDRVRLTFEYQDPNADVLAGRVGVLYSNMMVSGEGPITGQYVGTFFPQPQKGLIIDPPAGNAGVIVVDTCWLNVAHIDFSVQLKDGDENLSEEVLKASADIPHVTVSGQFATESDKKSKTGGGMKPMEW